MIRENKWWAKRSGKRVLVMSLDIEKAYDTIRWPFLWACLKQFGFGEEPEFLAWMDIIPAHASSRVLVNGKKPDGCAWVVGAPR